jgi:diadenosine tetraphosphate (Ap4A) HIT family hydrolase
MACDICSGMDPSALIDQTKHWSVFLSYNQNYIGRCIIVLKRHCGDLAELKLEEWQEFSGLVEKLESALREAFKATMFNWTCLMNDAYKNKNPEPHVHWHFIPRYNHQVKVAGLVFEDLDFGHHYDKNKERKVPENVKEIIILKIKEAL